MDIQGTERVQYARFFYSSVATVCFQLVLLFIDLFSSV